MKAIVRSLSVSVLALTAAGCSTPNPTALDRPGDVPVAFTAPVAVDAPIWPEAGWWTNFKAPELPALEETATKQNLDLAVAAAQVLQAEATDETAFAALLPTVSANGGLTRRGSDCPTASSTICKGPPVLAAGHEIDTNAFSTGISATYGFDLWGLSQDKLRQARETLRGSRYAEAAVGLTTAQSVANEYFIILSLRERITIARQNIDAANRILAVTQAKVTNGVSSNLDLSQQQSTVAGQQARIPPLIEQEREARYALAILLGRAPEGFDVRGQNLDGIVSPAVKPGIPSEVLTRRPDVAQAEANLYAAHANVDAARAAFFPQIGLTGSAGYASAAIDGLTNPGNFVWSFGVSLLQTIFDGGRLKAQDDSALANQMQLIATYRKTVFTAFSDVETQLGQTASDTDTLVALTEEVRASTEAFRIAELQYREGTIDIQSLLTTQQTLFTAQDSLVQTKLARLEADVGVYRALGGGWTQQADDAAYSPQLDWWPL
ncbi:MAG TPA: TolC family protein [Rhizomicrobium sp.]|jgi:multidrug efflux system outer membrane protein|nr:TolC family protein [Rhizomicrobium sp.]